jgi:hypothetical protein
MTKIIVCFDRFASIINNFVSQISDEKIAESSNKMRFKACVESSETLTSGMDFAENLVRVNSHIEILSTETNTFSADLASSLDEFKRIGDCSGDSISCE